MKRIAILVFVLMVAFCASACAEQVQGEHFRCDVPDDWTHTTADSGWWVTDAESGASILFMESYVPGFSGISRQEWPAYLADLMNESEEDIAFSDCLCKVSAGKLGWHSATTDGKTTNKIYFGVSHKGATLMAGCEWAGDQGLKEEIIAIFRSVDIIRNTGAQKSHPAQESAIEPETKGYSNMSLAELIEARQQIQQAMWETDEWQSVEVPPGIYKIGEDIPAGHWTITGTACLSLFWGKGVDEYGVDLTDTIDFLILDEGESVSWELVDGTYIKIGTMPAVFTPYIGKPDLGFK